jgi:hypothetical protein
VTNVAHQIGGSLGVGVLVAVLAAADSGGRLDGSALLANRISAALTAGAGLLAVSVLLVLTLLRQRAPSVPALS